jgi:CheY-like chemotaxis protein
VNARAPLILIADDCEDFLAALAGLLVAAGYRIACAHDGLQVVTRAIALRPSAVLMELSMPGLDGWEATRRIRADLRTYSIPVIVLTAYGLRRYADRAWAAGCSAFLMKPMDDGKILLDELARLLPRRPALHTSM